MSIGTAASRIVTALRGLGIARSDFHATTVYRSATVDGERIREALHARTSFRTREAATVAAEHADKLAADGFTIRVRTFACRCVWMVSLTTECNADAVVERMTTSAPDSHQCPTPAPTAFDKGDQVDFDGQPVVIVRIDSTGQQAEIYPGDLYDGRSSRGRGHWVHISRLATRSDTTAWRPRRSAAQQRRRPIHVLEVRCPDLQRDDRGLCCTCRRYLPAGPRPHPPNGNGQFGWLEFYADRSFFFVPPGQQPRSVR
ncbi:hypothetical protein ACFFMN_23330 [Planobispora siamensis]|uniref:Uncharacterized protein n=1 Tax=Planobispora siamensis TaxID=936338 RepID=A0A8J3SLE0_9ACTN|nr:hypothetical protein [Planobispora siamensis]GIH95295.1 hypothetical protein Psi01_59250 [Planobispora siamensis]